MSAMKGVKLNIDQKISLFKDSGKHRCRKLSALYGLYKSAILNVIERKAEYTEEKGIYKRGQPYASGQDCV